MIEIFAPSDFPGTPEAEEFGASPSGGLQPPAVLLQIWMEMARQWRPKS